MPITQRPKSVPKAPSTVDVEALISKGGSVGAGSAAQAAPAADERALASVVLRMPAPMLQRIDQALAKRPLKMPRHTWLLEAVLEKLEQEECLPEP